MTHSFPTRRSSDLVCAPDPGHQLDHQPAEQERGPEAGVDRAVFGSEVEEARDLDGEVHDHEPEDPPPTVHDPEGDEAEAGRQADEDRARSEENTSELQSLMPPSYAVFCLKKK